VRKRKDLGPGTIPFVRREVMEKRGWMSPTIREKSEEPLTQKKRETKGRQDEAMLMAERMKAGQGEKSWGFP